MTPDEALPVDIPPPVTKVAAYIALAFYLNFEDDIELTELGTHRRAVTAGTSTAGDNARDSIRRAVKQIDQHLADLTEPTDKTAVTAARIDIKVTYLDEDGKLVGRDSAWHASEGTEGPKALARNSLANASRNAFNMVSRRYGAGAVDVD